MNDPRAFRKCPDCGKDCYWHPPTDTHACSDPRCVSAHGIDWLANYNKHLALHMKLQQQFRFPYLVITS